MSSARSVATQQRHHAADFIAEDGEREFCTGLSASGYAVKGLQAREARERRAAAAIEVAGDTPEEFATYLKNEIAQWSKVIRDANQRAD